VLERGGPRAGMAAEYLALVSNDKAWLKTQLETLMTLEVVVVLTRVAG
jgi:hypothetical protein